MEWSTSVQWRDHCDTHLQSWKAQHCEVIMYRHTVIRPGYCPFCLWDPNLFAEERLRYWLRSDNLREHIEGQHLAKIRLGPTKPICGCSQNFSDERDLRNHLHDTHGLKETIWQNPKLSNKRKRTCKLEAQRPSTDPQNGHFKKARFHHDSPPRQEREHCMTEESFVPALAMLPSVEEDLEQYSEPSTYDKYSPSCRSNSVERCFSKAVSSPSSGPTTPGLDVIDPRILNSPKFDRDNAHQSCVQAAIQPNSLTFPPEECEATKMSLSGMNQPHPPDLGFANQPVGYCAVTETTEKRKDLQDYLTSLSNCDQATADSNGDSHSLTRAAGDRQNLPCDDQVPRSSPRRPLARIKTQTQSPQHHADGLSSCKPRQRFDAKSKRKLRDLQRKNLTLRQIGPHFADVDMALLRQAWMELKPSQRCTRSRANLKGK